MIYPIIHDIWYIQQYLFNIYDIWLLMIVDVLLGSQETEIDLQEEDELHLDDCWTTVGGGSIVMYPQEWMV